jgi:hypothetical protein
MGWSVWPGASWASRCASKAAEIVVHERQNLCGGGRVAGLHSIEK